MSYLEMAEAERTELAQLLGGLDAQQWEAPSLCEGWSVRDVVAHMLSFDERSLVGVMSLFLRGRLSFDRVGRMALADYAADGPVELLARLERHRRPQGFMTVAGGRVALLDGMIHQQDIRRPLGLPRTIPSDRLRTALEFAKGAPPLRASFRRKGLRLVATDVDWSAGEGDEVRGPGEAVLMAVGGRADALDELSGPGLPTLAERMG